MKLGPGQSSSRALLDYRYGWDAEAVPWMHAMLTWLWASGPHCSSLVTLGKVTRQTHRSFREI